MANITPSVPEDLYRLMRKYRSVNWSEVAGPVSALAGPELTGRRLDGLAE